ncbi:MAG: protein A* [Microviridae sp.]|nr:MAG: protein A* [Microviridae sp.]
MERVFPPKGHKSSAWTDYVRSVDRYFGEAAHGSYRKALKSGEDYHSYFAVVEKGSKTGRLHIHVVHCFKTMPRDFTDPNLGVSVPYRREIVALKNFWTYGFSSPIAIRFNAMDSFAQVGWRWPVKLKEDSYVPVMSKPFAAIVSYVGKYLTKALADKEVGCIWRTRTSRNLGKTPLIQTLKKMPLKSRLIMLQNPRLKLKLSQSRLPRLLLRRLLLKSLPLSIFRALYLRALREPVRNLLKLYRDMIENPMLCNLPKCGNTRIRTFRLTAVYNFFQEATYSYGLSGCTYAAA